MRRRETEAVEEERERTAAVNKNGSLSHLLRSISPAPLSRRADEEKYIAVWPPAGVQQRKRRKQRAS